jgi:putative restriction endonuclease
MTFDKSLLHNFLRDALFPYSEDFRVVEKRNPIQIRLNGHTYSIRVSYVHDSGNARDNADEVRIQIGRGVIDKQKARAAAGARVAFLGFFEGGNVFVAWDPAYIFSLKAKTNDSVYARLSQRQEVEDARAAIHAFKSKRLGKPSWAIALPADALGLYLENLQRFHQLDLPALRSVMQKADSATTETGLGKKGQVDVQVNGKRQKFTYTRKAYPRDAKFAREILAAYKGKCCVCGRQLGLVQAAHIIPHCDPDCPSTVQNGLALCIEHHRLYDDALLLPGPERTLLFNEARAKYLRETGRGVGLDGIKALCEKPYRIPKRPELQPSDEYLKRGIKIRLGG